MPPPPTHNVRPDFDKADWRDIELFKIVREHERREKGEKQVNWKVIWKILGLMSKFYQ